MNFKNNGMDILKFAKSDETLKPKPIQNPHQEQKMEPVKGRYSKWGLLPSDLHFSKITESSKCILWNFLNVVLEQNSEEKKSALIKQLQFLGSNMAQRGCYT